MTGLSRGRTRSPVAPVFLSKRALRSVGSAAQGSPDPAGAQNVRAGSNPAPVTPPGREALLSCRLASGGGASVRDSMQRVINALLARFHEYHDRRHVLRAEQGLALVLVVGILLGVGVLAATAVTRSEGETLFAQSSAREPSSSSGTEVSGTEVVTKTVERKGQPVRVVRRLETTVQDLTTLPGRTVRETQAITIRETHTATVREVATVTAIQPVTVTVFETVTCKPKDC